MTTENERLADRLMNLASSFTCDRDRETLIESAKSLRAQPSPADDAALIAEAERLANLDSVMSFEEARERRVYHLIRLVREGWHPSPVDRATEITREVLAAHEGGDNIYAKECALGFHDNDLTFQAARAIIAKHLDVPDAVIEAAKRYLEFPHAVEGSIVVEFILQRAKEMK